MTAGADAAQVAADKDGAVGQQLMTAAGVTGIPCALVVDSQGIVRFCGHPADPAFEAAIQQVHHSCLTCALLQAQAGDDRTKHAGGEWPWVLAGSACLRK